MADGKEFINKLILGDNLVELQKIPDESVDLIYADPPFFSNRTYEIIWGDDGERRSFDDRFAGDIDVYLSWLIVRVRQMHRILKDTGSIFLHCDWHANAEIKIDVLNSIFGKNNFRNEIIWSYKRYTAKSKKFQSLHDTIFWYSKGKDYTFYDTREDYGEKSGKMDSHYKQDEEGNWYRMQKRKGAEPYKIYLSEGKRLGDVWELPIINASAKERIGYPTQKPEALLQRIIEATTNEGDVVLDPFVGGGTTVAVADRLNRKWIGIDQSVMAVKVTELRLRKRQNELFAKPFEVEIPTFDLSKLQKAEGKQFEIFIVDKYGGIPNLKGGKDLGIDGHTQYGTPIQVKKWNRPVGRDTLDSFITAISRDDKGLFEKNKKEGQICGFIIGFDFSKDLKNEVARLANKENIIISLKYVKDIIPYDNPPQVTLSAEELENMKYRFEAYAESKAGIDFYSWDFNHNEEVFRGDITMDKTGVQEKKFPEGEHQVAVKAIDKQGLEGMDKVKIKVKK
ncbi:MAG: hypothetical protein LBR64_07030 [Dysgonamonadaceae bacterium]|jgi:DNA modification methylase|nr:hypothetical protein [Dysgonamonadaceae bacterium]